jgi:chemotaxis protein methyltransferase WspC
MNYASVRSWLIRHTPLEPSLLEGAGFEFLVRDRTESIAGGDQNAYIDFLERSSDEVERLIAGVAVPETWLFRYPKSFALLLDILRRRLGSGAASVSMISIGSAAGQEPFCMAMTALHAGWNAEQVRIDALDRNPEVLRAAQTGMYGASSIRGALPEWTGPYLHRDPEGIRVSAAVRNMVRFRQEDAAEWTADGQLDVVFCRNVLIYLNATARTQVARSICRALVPGGILFVGHAEQFMRTEPLLRPLAVPHTFALERVDAASPAPPKGSAPSIHVVATSMRQGVSPPRGRRP